MPMPYFSQNESDPYRPEGQAPMGRSESIAVTAGWAGLMLLLFACCCNIYLLIIAIVADAVAIISAFLARQENDGVFPERARSALIMASAALVISFVLAYYYYRIIHNDALMNEMYARIQAMFEQMTEPATQ